MDKIADDVRPAAVDQVGQSNNDNLVQVLHTQDTLLHAPGMPLARTEIGGGYFVSKNGTDCQIVTDSHILRDAKSAPYKDGQDIALDTSKPGVTEVVLPTGKILPAEIVSNDEEYDKAVLKVNAADAGAACRPDRIAGKALEEGEHVISSGFGNNQFNQQELAYVGALPVSVLGKTFDFKKEEGKLDPSMNLEIYDGRLQRGDSGGVLRNADGQIVGRILATAQMPQEDGSLKDITFAAPTSMMH